MPGNSLALDHVRQLRADGRHEEAREQLAALAKTTPADAEVLYEAASVHDYLDLEEQAVSYYVAAIEAGLSGPRLRGAYLGLGSTYRLLGRYDESLEILERGLREFPDGQEFRVFSAMTHYNLGRFQEAMGILLRVIADTSDDPDVRSYERAIRLHAENPGPRPPENGPKP
jgi:tetratricopeptide (TPR) repeat protein